MKKFFICVITGLIFNTLHSQKLTLYKPEDLDIYVKIFSNCGCGDYYLNDSTVLNFKLVGGKITDILILKGNKDSPEMKYLVVPKYKYINVKSLSYTKRKKTYTTKRMKYYSTRKLSYL